MGAKNWICCGSALVLIAGSVGRAEQAGPQPGAAPKRVTLSVAIGELRKEAAEAWHSGATWPRSECDFAQSRNWALPVHEVARVLGQDLELTASIQAYIKWQLLSFVRDLSTLDLQTATRIMLAAPQPVASIARHYSRSGGGVPFMGNINAPFTVGGGSMLPYGGYPNPGPIAPTSARPPANIPGPAPPPRLPPTPILRPKRSLRHPIIIVQRPGPTAPTPSPPSAPQSVPAQPGGNPPPPTPPPGPAITSAPGYLTGVGPPGIPLLPALPNQGIGTPIGPGGPLLPNMPPPPAQLTGPPIADVQDQLRGALGEMEFINAPIRNYRQALAQRLPPTPALKLGVLIKRADKLITDGSPRVGEAMKELAQAAGELAPQLGPQERATLIQWTRKLGRNPGPGFAAKRIGGRTIAMPPKAGINTAHPDDLQRILRDLGAEGPPEDRGAPRGGR